MSKIDITTIEYFKNPDRFADFFNLVLYHGEEVLHGSQLTAIDSQYNRTTNNKSNKRRRHTFKRYRDLINNVCAMESPHCILAILALEPFDYVDYRYPVRAMFYDALEYDRQIRSIASSNYNDPKVHLTKGGEQLTGLKKEDKIKPVITVALYLDPDPWDGPRSLHEMLDLTDRRLKDYIPDYRPIIISAEGLSPDDINNLKTGVRQLIKAIKYSGSGDNIAKFISSDPDFSICDKDTSHAINVITGLNIETDSTLKEVTMFKGVKEFYEVLEKKRMFDELSAKNDELIAKSENDAVLLAKQEASIAQKDASIAQKDEIIAKLISQISDAGMTPVVKP